MRLLAIGSAVGSFVALSQTAYGIVSDDSKVQSLAFEAANSAIPAPGQKLNRMESKQDAREQLQFANTLGNVRIERDVVGKDLRLVSGKLGLSTAVVFGSQANADKWMVAQSKNQLNRELFSQIVKKSLLRYVKNEQENLGIKSADLKLNDKKLFADSDTLLVSFDLVLDGVEVKGSSVDFRFSNGELVQIALRTFGASQSAAARAAAKIAKQGSRNDLQLARKVLGSEAKVIREAQAVVFVSQAQGGTGYQFEPALQLVASSATGESFQIVQSARTQEVLEWYSLHMKFEGKVEGVVNERTVGGNSVTVGLPFVQGTYKTGGFFGRTKSVKANEEGFLKTTNKVSKLNVTLESDFFKVINVPGNSASIDTSGDTLFDGKNNSTVAETSAFYHASVVRSFAKKYISTPWFDKQVPVKVNIKDSCNAYWDGDSVNFFQAGSKTSRGKVISCNNTGEIADVVYHEYGHGLDQNTGGIEDGAYSEGIGDILSMLITGSPLVGPGFLTDGKEVRNLEGDYQYPPKDKEVHTEGLIIGSTWYNLTQALEAKYGAKDGRDKAANLFFKSLFTTSQYVDSYNAVLALNAAGGSPEASPDFCIINAAYAKHGLAKKDATCGG